MKNQKGFTAIEAVLVLVVIAILGFTGWFAWHSKQNIDKTNNQAVTDSSSSTGTIKKSAKATLPPATDFWSCLPRTNGQVVKQNGTFVCMYQGKDYALPNPFKKQEILGMNKVPAAAQPLVIAVAKKTQADFIANAKNGSKTSFEGGQFEVIAAQSNFVDFGVGGGHEYFGLDNGAWVDLGGGQFGYGCDYVNKYHITQAAAVRTGGVSTTCTDYKTGKTYPIPKR